MIDFEIVTGMDIQDTNGNGTTTWTKKAEILKSMFKIAQRYHSRYDMPKIHKKVKAMGPFGYQHGLTGFKSRPKLLGGIETEKAIAVNASRIHRDSTGAPNDGRQNKGILNSIVCYDGIKRCPFVIDRVVRDTIKEIHEVRMGTRKRIARKITRDQAVENNGLHARL